MSHNEMYEASMKPRRPAWLEVILRVWLVVGISGLVWFAWAEPFSGKLFGAMVAAGVSPWVVNYVCLPLAMILRAVIAVEAVGYVYHRFFQHVGLITRTAQVFRRNQRYHWIHHMIIYPIGRLYKRKVAYVAAEPGVGLSWVIPGVIAAFLFVLTNGVNLGSAAFLFGIWFWSKKVLDDTHSRFHEVNHSWVNRWWFNIQEKIHILHHWDQRYNFTIFIPLMDIIFFTFLSPWRHKEELMIALADEELTVSDLINWRYVLVEATPAERAAFVTNAQKHSRSVRKIGLVLNLLDERISTHLGDEQARDLRFKATGLLREIGKDAAAVQASVVGK